MKNKISLLLIMIFFISIVLTACGNSDYSNDINKINEDTKIIEIKDTADSMNEKVSEDVSNEIISSNTAEIKNDLVNIINSSRPAELNEFFPTTSIHDTDPIIFEFMGLSAVNFEDVAVSLSMMNIDAYAIMIAKSDNNQDIINGLTNYIEIQKSNFESYLVDQYKIASNTILKEYNGYIIMVMCENNDEIYLNICNGIDGI